MNTNEKNLNLVADNVDSYDHYHDTGSNGRHFLMLTLLMLIFVPYLCPLLSIIQRVLYLRSLIIAFTVCF